MFAILYTLGMVIADLHPGWIPEQNCRITTIDVCYSTGHYNAYGNEATGFWPSEFPPFRT